MAETPQELENNSGPEREADGRLKPGGPSLNPGGRPKGSYSIMGLIRERMEQIPVGQTKAWREQVADKILELAVVNNSEPMLKLLANYMDGMPTTKIALDTDKESLDALTLFFKGMANGSGESKGV